MAKSAIITLTTAGTDTGPFNLLSDVDSYATPFETNVAKSSLIAGYTTNLIPDAATIIRVQSSSSLCTNFINLTYPTISTTTTTTTTTAPTTSTTTTTTTVAPTTSTTTTTTTAAPTTSTTTTTTTAAPTTSTTTTTTTANPSGSLFFDASTGVGGYSVTAIDVNGVTPTLTSGTNVPFNTDGHGFATNQTGTNETLNITIGGFTLNGCVSVTDSNLNTYTQNIGNNGTKTFTGLVINNITTVQVALTDGNCPP